MMRNLKTELEALDAELVQVRLPPLRQEPPLFQPWLAFAGALALAALIAGAWLTLKRPLGVTVADASPEFRMTTTADAYAVDQGTATLVLGDLGVRLAVRPHVRFRRQGHTLRIIAGVIDVDVEHHEQPLRILVSHGAIEVIGTAFTITQERDSGNVVLNRGVIRFVTPDGREVMMKPGDRVSWPLAQMAAAEPAPERAVEPAAAPTPAEVRDTHTRRGRPHAKPPTPPPTAIENILPDELAIAEIDALRIRKRYRELVQRIDAVMPTLTSSVLRDSLSYERCDVLANRLDEHAEACACARSYEASFAKGRYHDQVAALAASSCP